jgi:hypothetical protein
MNLGTTLRGAIKEDKSYPLSRLWGPAFPVRCDHHLHIKKQSYNRNRPWRPIGVFPMRYENHLNVKKYPHKRPWKPIGFWNVEELKLS